MKYTGKYRWSLFSTFFSYLSFTCIVISLPYSHQSFLHLLKLSGNIYQETHRQIYSLSDQLSVRQADAVNLFKRRLCQLLYWNDMWVVYSVILKDHMEIREKLNLKVINMENGLERIRSTRQNSIIIPQIEMAKISSDPNFLAPGTGCIYI